MAAMAVLLALSCCCLRGEQPQLANPASAFCEEQGYRLEIRESEEGEHGLCVFNGEECEEWAFYRGECGKEYVKVECAQDSDCVPEQCCHPTSCGPRRMKPDCSGIACTEVCQAGTLDCGQGSCRCVDGKCEAELD